MAAAVAALVGAAGCGNCLVWSKSDAFVTAYQREAAAPHLVGYIVAAEADEALARPLRLAAPEVHIPFCNSRAGCSHSRPSLAAKHVCKVTAMICVMRPVCAGGAPRDA